MSSPIESELDLAPLEKAAHLAGLVGMRARVIPTEVRLDRWFLWEGTDLQVSESVVEHCPPGDAAALLVQAVIESKHRHRLSTKGQWLLICLLVGAGGAQWAAVGLGWPILAVGLMALLVWWLGRRTGVAFRADDETVELMKNAEPLVRGMNRMNHQEMHLGRHQIPVRPDLHRRAERLVRLHGLACEERPGNEVGHE